MLRGFPKHVDISIRKLDSPRMLGLRRRVKKSADTRSITQACAATHARMHAAAAAAAAAAHAAACIIWYNRFMHVASGHNKWIYGSVWCMYVWEQLHVQGRRISGPARHRQKITDSYPFKKKHTRCYRVNFGTFSRSG